MNRFSFPFRSLSYDSNRCSTPTVFTDDFSHIVKKHNKIHSIMQKAGELIHLANKTHLHVLKSVLRYLLSGVEMEVNEIKAHKFSIKEFSYYEKKIESLLTKHFPHTDNTIPTSGRCSIAKKFNFSSEWLILDRTNSYIESKKKNILDKIDHCHRPTNFSTLQDDLDEYIDDIEHLLTLIPDTIKKGSMMKQTKDHQKELIFYMVQQKIPLLPCLMAYEWRMQKIGNITVSAELLAGEADRLLQTIFQQLHDEKLSKKEIYQDMSAIFEVLPTDATPYLHQLDRYDLILS